MAGPLATHLYMCAVIYANKFLTDGFITHSAVPRLTSWDGVFVSVEGKPRPVDAYQLADVLVTVGRFEKVTGGYRIVNFTEDQRSREQVEAEREGRSKGGKMTAEKRWGNRHGSSGDGSSI